MNKKVKPSMSKVLGRKKLRPTLRNVQKMERYLNNLKHTITGERAMEIMEDYGERLVLRFRDIINDKVNDSSEHVEKILSCCYYTATPKSNHKIAVRIANNSPKFKYFEYGTGYEGYKYSYSGGFEDPDAMGWKYGSGRSIINAESVRNLKYWTVRQYSYYVPEGKKKTLRANEVIGGWFFNYGSMKRLYTKGQRPAFALSQLQRDIQDSVDDLSNSISLVKLIKLKLPRVPVFDNANRAYNDETYGDYDNSDDIEDAFFYDTFDIY